MRHRGTCQTTLKYEEVSVKLHLSTRRYPSNYINVRGGIHQTTLKYEDVSVKLYKCTRWYPSNSSILNNNYFLYKSLDMVPLKTC